MKKYRLLMNGRNFLIDTNKKPRKHGFYQMIDIEADNPQKAGLLAKAMITHDKELIEITLNKKKDPPVVHLHTFWELDIADDVDEIDPSRTFYLEKRWWQFWKKDAEPSSMQSGDLIKA
jgi:hypothetical protein